MTDVLQQASTLSKEFQDSYIAIDVFLLALQSDPRFGKSALEKVGIDNSKLKTYIQQSRKKQKVVSQSHENTLDALAKYGRDLTEEAKAGKLDPVIGRNKEISRIATILSRRQKNNPVIIGEPGVGKTAVVEGLAQRVVARACQNMCDPTTGDELSTWYR